MNPYSHIILAKKVEHLIEPENSQEYLWGAVVPDIRYLAGFQRSQTHLSSQRITELIPDYPHLKSFLQGYLIHCLLDGINIKEIFYSTFPLSLLKGKLYRHHISAILEFFYLENQKGAHNVAGNCNEVLSDLGLTELHCSKYIKILNQYLTSTSIENQISSLLKLIGLENDNRVDKYTSVAERFQKSWILENIFFLGIRRGRINDQIVSQITNLLKENTLPPGN